jgi:hypothetical protein
MKRIHKMTTKDEALKMAIEALIQAHKQLGEYWDADIKRGYYIEEMDDSPMLSCRDALQACKKALEQPAPRPYGYALNGKLYDSVDEALDDQMLLIDYEPTPLYAI